MKLRQKLAIVLATAMVVTAVPVTTMAKTTNTLTKTVSVVDGTDISNREVFLSVKAEADVAASEVFFIKAHDFEFNNETMYNAAPAIKVLGEKVNAITTKAVTDVLVEKYTTVGTVTITLGQHTSNNAVNVISNITVTALGTTESTVTVYDASTNLLGGLMDSYEVALENYNKTFAGQVGGMEVTWLDATTLKVKFPTSVINGTTEIKVPVYGKAKSGNPMLEVLNEDSHVSYSTHLISGGEVVSTKTLAATAADPTNISVEGFGKIADITISEKVKGELSGQKLTLKLPNRSDVKFSPSTITFTGKMGLAGSLSKTTLAVTSADITNDGRTVEIQLPNSATDVKGSIVIGGLELAAKDARKDCKEGDIKVTASIKDKMDDTSLVVAKVVNHGVSVTTTKDFTLEAGRGAKELEIKIKENAEDSISTKRDIYVKLDGARFSTEGVVSVKVGDTDITANCTVNEKTNELAIDTAAFGDSKIDEIVVKTKVHTVAAEEADEITLTVESRDLDSKVEHTVGEITRAYKVESKGMTLKVGKQNQIDEASKIVITEAEAGKFVEGSKIVVAFNGNDGFTLKKATVEVEGDLEYTVDYVGNTLEIEIDTESDEASAITISDIKVDVDRTVPEGTFDVVLKGDAICDASDEECADYAHADHVIVLGDFINVATKNTEDINDASKASEVILTMGATTYVKDGEVLETAAAPFVDEATSRTMAPLRLVGDAFNCTYTFARNAEGKMVVTFFKDGQAVQFVDGSNVMNKNGVVILMDANAQIVEGTTYVPVSFLANALGIKFSWENETKTVTFFN